MKRACMGMLMAAVLSFAVVGCDETTASTVVNEEAYTKQLMNQMNSTVGMPEVTNFTEKKMAKEIIELRDDANLITYTYTQNKEGQYIFLGTTMGFGLPYSVQYTAPQVDDYKGNSSGGYTTLTTYQPDPNGLYMPEGLSATWVMMINEQTGKREAMYIESEITVTQSKLPRRLCAEWSLPDNY